MSKKNWQIFSITIIIALLFSLMGVITVWSRPNLAEYPSPTFAVTFYLQMTSNWCGPDTLQSEIQYVNQYNDGTPANPTVAIIPKATLWAFMRDNSCKNMLGRDDPLPGVVGDGNTDVRKLNIAYDFGVDPHAMAWTMWVKTGAYHYYHYWVYNDVDTATNKLLWTLEKYHEPVIVAAWQGSHWVLVTGYKADAPAYPGPAGTIYQIKVADPLDGSINWYNYSGGDKPWTSYWFTAYANNNNNDPDPATGWYKPPPDHWINHFVTIERDSIYAVHPDVGMSPYGYIPTHSSWTYLPLIRKP